MWKSTPTTQGYLTFCAPVVCMSRMSPRRPRTSALQPQQRLSPTVFSILGDISFYQVRGFSLLLQFLDLGLPGVKFTMCSSDLLS